MINTALISDHSQYNEFTRKLAKKCKTKGSAVVQLRNGNLIEVTLHKRIRGGIEQECFIWANDKPAFRPTWYLDGACDGYYMFDMLMMGSKKLLTKNWKDFV